MSNRYSDRVLALAGLAQALHQVRRIAETGQSESSAVQASLESVFRIDAATPLAVYGRLGDVTPGRIAILREADRILIEEVRRHGIYHRLWQAFAVLLPVKSVGVMGDERTYENACVLRAVVTTDFMTADFARIPHEVLGRTAARIVNEVKGINRVAYDVTTKPPATIEWE